MIKKVQENVKYEGIVEGIPNISRNAVGHINDIDEIVSEKSNYFTVL